MNNIPDKLHGLLSFPGLLVIYGVLFFGIGTLLLDAPQQLQLWG